MTIDKVTMNNYFVFKNAFEASFSSGVNIIIGSNGLGKTTLLKALYEIAAHKDSPRSVMQDGFHSIGNLNIQFNCGSVEIKNGGAPVYDIPKELRSTWDNAPHINCVYIPEKDILEHSRGLLTFIEKKESGFGQIYRDVLINAMDTPTKELSDIQKEVKAIISKTIDGEIRYDKGNGSFYTMKSNGDRVMFSNEASGFKKLGYLGLLIESGQIDKDSILFWDEPENSLNPELIPVLVEILLKLQSGGVQIFMATHSELLANYFSILRKGENKILFHSFSKSPTGSIIDNSSDRFDLLDPNLLTAEPVRLYEKEIERAFANG